MALRTRVADGHCRDLGYYYDITTYGEKDMNATKDKPTVLIIDDEPTNLRILRETLVSGHTVFIANNGKDGLNIATLKNPDLILLDIMMPEMDGYEVCERLKADTNTRNIPIIFISAKDAGEDETKGFTLGAVDYIAKPINVSVVLARVKTHLALRTATMALERQNDALRETVQLRDDVDQIIRHDLKGPLNIIIGMQDVMLHDNLTLTPEQREQFLRIIEESGYRMLDMINRSHDLYKMEKGIYEVNAQPVNILVICNRLMSAVQTLLANKNIELNILLHGKPVNSDDSFIVCGEELLIYSMLSNLIKNAIEASPRSEVVTIFLTKTDISTIRMSNKGSVPITIRDKFFEKYVTSEKQQGVGLGTYSAKLIATTQGGKMYLDVSTEGETSIVIQFPLDRAVDSVLTKPIVYSQ